MGYHLREIERGTLGQLSKIQEELNEALDAHAQGCEVMVLLELSDMLGAVRAYLETRHPSMTLGDLIVMSDITRRAFMDGSRRSSSPPCPKCGSTEVGPYWCPGCKST